MCIIVTNTCLWPVFRFQMVTLKKVLNSYLNYHQTVINNTQRLVVLKSAFIKLSEIKKLVTKSIVEVGSLYKKMTTKN